MAMYRRALIIFATALATLGTTCGYSFVVIRRYQLSKAPLSTFSLPKEAEGNGDRLKRTRPSRISDPCAGFTTYEFSKSRGGLGVHVRLVSSEPPFLEVAYGYLTGFVAEKPDPGREKDLGNMADVAARLVLRGSGVEPSLPPRDEVRLRAGDEVERWCRGG